VKNSLGGHIQDRGSTNVRISKLQEREKNSSYEEKFTVEGARRRLKAAKKPHSKSAGNLLKEIKEELKQILKILQ